MGTLRSYPAAIGLLSLVAATAQADLRYGVEVGAGYSDNITRVDSNEVNETIGSVGVDLTWAEVSRRLEADVNVDLSYFEYLDDTFDGEVVGIADGSLVFGIVPDRFTWLLQDTFGQAQSDPFSPVTPDNREDVNYFTTGPDLILRFGSVTSLRLFGRYSATNYEVSALDAERTSAGFALARHISQRSEVALNAVTEEIDFDDAGTGDYDRESAFVSYSLDGPRTDLDVELGYSWLTRVNDEKTGGLLANVTVVRDLSASSTLRMQVGAQFSDAGEALRGAAEGGAVGGADITATGDPFENRSASLQWSFNRNRTSVSLGAGWNEDSYETQTLLDRTRMVCDAMFARRLSPVLELTLLAVFNQEQFDNVDLESDELTLQARLTWRLGRNFEVAASVERYDRNTSDGLGEYTENRAFLMLAFRPVRAAAAGAPARP